MQDDPPEEDTDKLSSRTLLPVGDATKETRE